MIGKKKVHVFDTDRDKKFLLEPYNDWADAEGPPVHADFAINAIAAETGHWPRFDCKGAFLHVHGRGDYCSAYTLDIDPGKKTAPIRHLYEPMFYGLEGHGSTIVDLPDGTRHSFEWGPKSLFTIPLNTPYQIFNGSGADRALLACTHDLPFTLNLYHDEKFVFENDFVFEQRLGDPKYYDGDGDFTPIKPGRHMWETTYVPDLTNFELHTWVERGAGGANIVFVLADGTMHAHVSEIPVARYKKGHRHGAGVHIWAVTGSGYSLLWYEGDKDFLEVPWTHGWLYAPAEQQFHQHFNTSPDPARYLAISLGNRRYPLLKHKRDGIAGETDASIKEGGRQVEYEDQDQRIHKKWLEEMAKAGVQPDMAEYIDESAFAS